MKIFVDILMFFASLFMMGGNYFLPIEVAHGCVGVFLFVLWLLHVVLNRKWYKTMFRGKYSAVRFMQIFINSCILICALFLMISAVMLSEHVFAFLGIEGVPTLRE